MHLRKTYLGCFVTIVLMAHSCVEPFDAKTETFESALVIDATITNEMKQQEIFLSRSFRIEDDGPAPESGANVSVVDDTQNQYTFAEESPGRYLSTSPFAAAPGRSYQLQLTTNTGRTYTSDMVQLTAVTQIDNLYAERIVNDDGDEGMALFVDSFDPTDSSKNYRYEFAETYKIIAPDWTPDDLIPGPNPDCNVLVVPRTTDQETCFTTDVSRDIILTDTNDLNEDRVSRFLVRFINRNNYIITHRYSIMVRQLVQSNEAYTFFETLRDFSGSESLFSETQPGFLAGNVFSVESSNEKVLGYFDVASVTEERIFFNYDDFFPGEPLPPYADPCARSSPPLTRGNPPVCVLRNQVVANLVRYVGSNSAPGSTTGPHEIVPRVCGDCTVLGKTEIPEFWIE